MPSPQSLTRDDTAAEPASAARRRPALGGGPITGRAAVLVVVVASLLVSLALPVREYVEQRGEIAALQSEKERREARVAELQERLRRWDDPAYVSTQARQRLQFVLPGEVGYVVLDPEPSSQAPEAAVLPPGEEPAPENWYTRLWGSVEAADEPRAPATTPPPAPAR